MQAEADISMQIRQRLLRDMEQRALADSSASVDSGYRAVYESASPSRPRLVGRVVRAVPFYVMVGSASLPGTLGFQSSHDIPQIPVVSSRVEVIETDASQSPLERFLQQKVSDARAAVADLSKAAPLFAPYGQRLEELVDLALDEYPETDIPSPASIAAFGKVLSAFSQLRAPSLSLLPSGAIWLNWKQAQRGSGGMAIFRDGTASFGMLLDNPERPSRPIHVNVSGDLKSVLAAMGETKSSSWIGEFA